MKDWVKAFKDNLLLFLVSLIGPIFILLLGRTLRIKWIGEENIDLVRENGGKVIYAFWHGRMLILSYSHCWQKIHVLISQHRDGEFIVRIIEKLGFVSVRGSTTRGGTKAFFEMAKKVESGYDIGITPDGPKGPRFKVQAGAIYVAQRSQMPIIPITNSAERRWILPSWDGFLIPKPFSKAVIIIGEPIYVYPDSSPEELEAKKEELESKLVEVTRQADTYFSGSLK